MAPCDLGARDAAQQIRAGTLGVVELVRSCLERIAAREPVVGAFAYLDPERLLEDARAAEAAGAPGPLAGVPVAIKDIIDTADMPTAYGSPIYDGHRPATDAACVRAIRAAGGLIAGKTVTTEFAFRHPFGATRNPHDPAHTPGGSSSGSAAGVADRMFPLALGTQTGGSVIRPAAFCGVYGYKPSFGLLDTAGVKPLAPSLDTLGVFARDPADLAWLAAALGAGTAQDPAPLEAPPRIRVTRMPQWHEARDETVAAVDGAAGALAGAGADIDEASGSTAFEALAEAHAAIMAFEARRTLEVERTTHQALLSDALREILERAGSIAEPRYAAAREAARRARADIDSLFGGADVLLTASAPGEAPAGHASTGSHVFNRVWTLLGVPCLTVPAARGPAGLPVGVQLVARPGADERLLATVRWAGETLDPRAGRRG